MRKIAIPALVLLGLSLSGCSQAEKPEPEAPEVGLPSEEEIEEYLQADCADIVSADVARTLNDAGWTASAVSPWTIDELSLAEGMLCEWTAEEGDPMSYGWAQGTAEEGEQAREWLAGNGWVAQQEEGATVFTDDGSGSVYIVSDSHEIRFSTTLDGARAVRAPA